VENPLRLQLDQIAGVSESGGVRAAVNSRPIAPVLLAETVSSLYTEGFQ